MPLYEAKITINDRRYKNSMFLRRQLADLLRKHGQPFAFSIVTVKELPIEEPEKQTIQKIDRMSFIGKGGKEEEE